MKRYFGMSAELRLARRDYSRLLRQLFWPVIDLARWLLVRMVKA